ILGSIIALLFAYVPGFANWYEPMDGTKKRLIMLGILVVITAAIFGLSCAGILTTVLCTQKDAIALVNALILAVIANQGTYAILPKAGLNK
ncbi:hypothetical protein MUP35_03075, partial [Patescibacteria group bacterium]|nr:hypothetical protein [Patescibacteria group bacterium]